MTLTSLVMWRCPSKLCIPPSIGKCPRRGEGHHYRTLNGLLYDSNAYSFAGKIFWSRTTLTIFVRNVIIMRITLKSRARCDCRRNIVCNSRSCQPRVQTLDRISNTRTPFVMKRSLKKNNIFSRQDKAKIIFLPVQSCYCLLP